MRLGGLIRIFAVLAVLAPAGAMAGEASTLPAELAAFSKRHKCSPNVRHESSNLPERLYAYGYVAGRKKTDSAVFWCESDDDTSAYYRLIFMYRDSVLDTDGCPNIIKGRNNPGSLEIFQLHTSTLSDFVYLDDPHKLPPTGGYHNNMAVESSYPGEGDIVREIYYCHEGKWLVHTIKPQRDI